MCLNMNHPVFVILVTFPGPRLILSQAPTSTSAAGCRPLDQGGGNELGVQQRGKACGVLPVWFLFFF